MNYNRLFLWILITALTTAALYTGPLKASGIDLDDDENQTLYTMGITGSVVSLGMTLINKRALNTEDAGRITGLIGAASGIWTTGFGVGVAALFSYYSDEDKAEYITFGAVTAAIGIVSTYYGVKAFKHGRRGAITDDESVNWKVEPIVICEHSKEYDLGIQFSASF